MTWAFCLSIFLDVNFRLEQVFGIKMARNFVLEHVEEMFGEGVAINEESEVTEKGVEVLKLRQSEAAVDLEPGTPVDELPGPRNAENAGGRGARRAELPAREEPGGGGVDDRRWNAHRMREDERACLFAQRG